MTKYLKCHTNLYMYDDKDTKPEALAGNLYRITLDTEDTYAIVNESGDDHYFDKEGEGSFEHWFEEVDSDDMHWSEKNPLTVQELIAILMEVEDKSKVIKLYDNEFDEYNNASEVYDGDGFFLID